MLKISTITVTRNNASTIGVTLSSIAAQSYSDIECIVIDGASTDSTATVVRQYKNVSTFLSEPDAGIYDAMNKGLSLACGDIICFLNADDHYANADVLTNVATQMEREGLDAVFGDVAFFRHDAPERLIRRYRSSHFKPARLAWGWMPSHPALFVRRDVYQQTGGFRTKFKIAGDYEWVVRAFKSNEIRYQHRPEVLVHMQTGGISTRGWRSTLLLNREVMQACRDNGVSTNWFKILSKYPLKLLEYVLP